jgi:plasmid stabilization system protein ParE
LRARWFILSASKQTLRARRRFRTGTERSIGQFKDSAGESSEGTQAMPRGDKSSYTDKQKRKAEHIEEGYEDRGVSKGEAERRAWATVNKESGGGKKSGSGRGKKENHRASRKGGHKSGSSQSHEKRSAAAKKGWETRRRHGNG